MRIPSFAIAATLGLLVGLVASGCGSDDEDNTNPGGSGGATGGTGGTGFGGTGGMTGGTGGATGGTGGATGGTGGATGGTGGATGGTGGATGGTGGSAGQATGGSAGEAGAAGSAGAGGDDCTEISLADFEVYNSNNLLASISPELGTDEDDLAVIEFWEWDDYEQVPGTFDLSQAPNDNYETCTHCVVVFEDDSGRTFFQRSGTLELTNISSPPDGVFAGSLANVELEEVTIDDTTYVSTPVPGGACLRIVAASFDTDNTGDACTAHTDCLPNICDPATLTCVAPQCDSTTPCTTQDDVCYAGAVCMPGCEPFATGNGCDPTDTCVIMDEDLSVGYCQAPGTIAAGETCTPYLANSTDCVAGAFCGQVASSTFECVEQCNFFSASAACSLGTQYCSYGGWCWTGTPNAAALGAGCAAADQYADCGLENGIARGMCVNTTDPDLDTDMTCAKWCRVGTNTDCDTGETCEDVLGGSSIGFCVAAP